MAWETLVLWQQIVVYVAITISAVSYALLSKIQILGRPIIRWQWRAMIALAFPLLLVVGTLFGLVALGVLGIIVVVGGLLSLLGIRKKKPSQKRRFVIKIG